MAAGAVEALQHLTSGIAQRTVGGRVPWKAGRGYEGSERRVCIGHLVAVNIGVANRRFRPPKVVSVLCIERRYRGVTDRDVEYCERARVFNQRLPLRDADLSCDGIPDGGWRDRRIEPRHVGTILGTKGTV